MLANTLKHNKYTPSPSNLVGCTSLNMGTGMPLEPTQLMTKAEILTPGMELFSSYITDVAILNCVIDMTLGVCCDRAIPRTITNKTQIKYIVEHTMTIIYKAIPN